MARKITLISMYAECKIKSNDTLLMYDVTPMLEMIYYMANAYECSSLDFLGLLK